MNTYIPEFPAACFKGIPDLDAVLSGTAGPISEFVMPIAAVKMAGLATEATLSRLVEYFQELSKQHPMAIVIFISAVSANKEAVKFAVHNREFMGVAAKLGKYFQA
jgi:hypothetical protein